MHTIKNLTQACLSCRTYSTKTFRLRASLPPEKVYFNHELPVDLFLLDQKPVLHIVDTHTHFQNALPTRTKRAEYIWLAFVEGWKSLYVGNPSLIRLDQEASFMSDLFQSEAGIHVIELSFSGVESHNSIDVDERYHTPLGRIYNIPLPP